MYQMYEKGDGRSYCAIFGTDFLYDFLFWVYVKTADPYILSRLRLRLTRRALVPDEQGAACALSEQA